MSPDILDEKTEVSRALLVGICRLSASETESEALLGELKELVRNLDIEVAASLTVKLREGSPHYLVGKGKFEEIVKLAHSANADTIVLDDELSPAQQRNWEIESGLAVVNRQEVILDIFAKRAMTREARLQVELAKLEYSLPRLRRAWSHLDRQRGGGVTQRGGGESQLELDRRFIRSRISKLKEELAGVRTMREVQRKRRSRIPVPTAAVVGYTNAGKSSLINALASASLLAEDKLFATLDPSTRALALPNSTTLLLTDTVGFVRKLPHRFVEAFKATLEEAKVSDFLIHVVDASSPDAQKHAETTMSVLKELGADDKRIITVLNKLDKVKACSGHSDMAWLGRDFPNAVWVSAKTREGFERLFERLEEMLSDTSVSMKLLIPHSAQPEIAALYKAGAVKLRKDIGEGVQISANIPIRMLKKYLQFSQ